MSPHCQNCGAFVSQSFVRVFGQNGDLAACPNCTEQREMAHGEGVPDEHQ
jgi:NAD-dependent SIR2 family protein deacetylase